MKILVCDDDVDFTEQLSKDIICFFEKRNIEINIKKKSNNFLQYLEFDFQVIFMDIDLIEMSGIDLAEIFREKAPTTLIVFMSSRNDLIFDTLSIGIFQFIRKNNYERDFLRTMTQIYEYYLKKEKSILLDINKRKTKIILSDIMYVMSIGHEILIKCYNKEYTVKSTLKNFLDQADFSNLIQVQRNLIVNIDYVIEFYKWGVECGGATFDIGRKYQKDFLKAYERYLLR